MGHRPEMVKISPACVGHNKKLSPLESITPLGGKGAKGCQDE